MEIVYKIKMNIMEAIKKSLFCLFLLYHTGYAEVLYLNRISEIIDMALKILILIFDLTSPESNKALDDWCVCYHDNTMKTQKHVILDEDCITKL